MKLFNKQKPWTYLLLIPLQLVLDVIVYIAVALFESSIITSDPTHLGHPFPALTLIAMMGMCIMTIITALAAVILTIKYTLQKK